MSVQENVRLLKEAYASFQKGDIKAILNMLADDVEWTTCGPPDILPLAGTHHGRGEVAEMYDSLANYEEVELFTPTDVIAEGDKVVVLFDYRSKVKATQRTVECSVAHVYTFRDGKIQRCVEYYDTAAAVDAYRPGAATASPGR